MSRTYTAITPQVAEYIRGVTVREPEALRRLRESTENHPQASCQISPEQGQFLHVLARAMGARRTLEIGAFMGYSSTWVALALLPGGQVLACDRSAEYAERARQTWREAGVEDRVHLRLAPALETLDALLREGQAGTFDLAFIDADKENYLAYYERAFALVRPRGMIVADNVLWSGRVANPDNHDRDTEALRAFNRALHNDPRVVVSIVPTGDGFSLAQKL
ncbi:MAG TPA: class I SAM-dependent methyltransferase [Bryobacteraceae bacterium]|nr:class I SAM-dependent methyltransferase [Bryobacteraceae bacterium]